MPAMWRVNRLDMVSGRFLEKRGFIDLIMKPNRDTGRLMYQCPKCGETFIMYKRLKAHRKEVHAY